MTQLVGGGLAQQRSNKIVLIRGRNTETLEHTKHTSPPLLIPGILRFMKILNFSHLSCFRECQNNHIYIISFYKGPKTLWQRVDDTLEDLAVLLPMVSLMLLLLLAVMLLLLVVLLLVVVVLAMVVVVAKANHDGAVSVASVLLDLAAFLI